MCWRTYYGMLSVQRTATKDIHVKKVFVKCSEYNPHPSLYSFFNRRFKWSLGQIHKERLYEPTHIIFLSSSKKLHVWKVRSGFHSAKEIEVKWDNNLEVGSLIIAGKASGYFSKHAKPFLENQVVIHDCIIPKGSKYYVNEYREYVSDQLIVLLNS